MKCQNSVKCAVEEQRQRCILPGAKHSTGTHQAFSGEGLTAQAELNAEVLLSSRGVLE